MQQSHARVRRIIEDQGKTLVSFDGHDAYFIAGSEVIDALHLAAREGLVVHFTYDDRMTITGVVAHAG